MELLEGLKNLYERTTDKCLLDKEVIKRIIEELEELNERDGILSALECTGVDNWYGYGDAMELLEEWEEESKKNEGKE